MFLDENQSWSGLGLLGDNVLVGLVGVLPAS